MMLPFSRSKFASLELRLAVSETPLCMLVLEQRFCDAVCFNLLDDCLLRLNERVITVWLSARYSVELLVVNLDPPQQSSLQLSVVCNLGCLA